MLHSVLRPRVLLLSKQRIWQYPLIASRLRYSTKSDVRQEWLKKFVLQNTTIVNGTNTLTPEIQLRLITPQCEIWNATENDLQLLRLNHGVDAPFWGFWWPGGQSIARYILDNENVVRGKTVLDLGAGGGGVAIACKLVNAAHVCVNDIDTCALAACDINASLNNVTLEEYCDGNLIGETTPNKRWDVILAGDICYDAEFAQQALAWLRLQVSLGAQVFIGDPGRAYLPRIGCILKLIHTYPLPPAVEEQNHGLVNGSVYSVRAP